MKQSKIHPAEAEPVLGGTGPVVPWKRYCFPHTPGRLSTHPTERDWKRAAGDGNMVTCPQVLDWQTARNLSSFALLDLVLLFLAASPHLSSPHPLTETCLVTKQNTSQPWTLTVCTKGRGTSV